MTDWWLELDRTEAQDEFRKLIPKGGCLVVEGEDGSGRGAAARLLASRARDFGYEAFAISMVKRDRSVKQLLLGAWELVEPEPPDAVIRRWRVPGGRLTLDEVIAELGATLKALGHRMLIFETPDRHDRLTRDEASAFGELAEVAECPIVVTSRKESRTRWPSGPSNAVIQLADFSRDDVVATLMQSTQLRRHSLAELSTVADMITGGSATIAPDLAYTRLYAWGQQ